MIKLSTAIRIILICACILIFMGYNSKSWGIVVPLAICIGILSDWTACWKRDRR